MALPSEGRHQKQEELGSCSPHKDNDKHRRLDKGRWHRNMFQMKEKCKNPQEQLNEEEIGDQAEKEFRVMIVKMIQNLGKRMEAQTEKI